MPIFFVDIGLLIDVPGFIKSISSIWLTLAVLVGLIGSKFMAAFAAKLLYRYNWREAITMWSLSMPQVAATLAATFVGYRAGMLTEEVLNSVIVLMLVTSTLGPLITARAASELQPTDIQENQSEFSLTQALQDDEEDVTASQLTIVVPVYNPQTEQNLMEMAALLARHESGKVVPLSIATAHVHMDSPELNGALQRGKRLLANATEISREFGVDAEPLLRIDDGIAQGISRASREQQAGLIIMGWGRTKGFRAQLFGSVIDNVMWASHCPVAVTRLFDSPSNIRRILVPIKTPNLAAIRLAHFAEILADANKAEVTLLHVYDRFTSQQRLNWVKSRLDELTSRYLVHVKPTIQTVMSDQVANTIVETSKNYDLIVLRTLRRRINLGELAISDITNEVARQVQCSIVTLGEPHRNRSALW
ncbi:MAG TPA: universal stress protein, partial [Allocoleopsis sp.]